MNRILTTIFSFIFLLPSFVFAAEENVNYDFYLQDFVVSAYYSPLPDQVRYMRGSYEADIILNGRGTNGADGTEVFMGMLAAPKSYNFGTKIELPGLGTGAVHDRGGAIVEKDNYHRIDVWMGHGDEGLTRALNWGMRSVTGKVFFEKNPQITLDYHVIPATSPQLAQAKQAKQAAATFTKNLALGAVDAQVPKLKRVLHELDYFHGEVRNNYFGPDLEQAVIRFQIDEGVISSAQSYGAGHVGLNTRNALNNEVIEKQTSYVTQSQQQIQMTVQSGLGKNATGEEVKKLQLLLSGLGYYNGPADGSYNDDMIGAVFAFQKEQGVVQSDFDTGAGYFGKKTKSALDLALKNKQEKIAQFPVIKEEVFTGEKKQEPLVSAATFKDDVAFPNAKFVTFVSNFSIGDEGEAIQALQRTLAQQGYLDEKYITGYYGPITVAALKKAGVGNS